MGHLLSAMWTCQVKESRPFRTVDNVPATRTSATDLWSREACHVTSTRVRATSSGTGRRSGIRCQRPRSRLVCGSIAGPNSTNTIATSSPLLLEHTSVQTSRACNRQRGYWINNTTNTTGSESDRLCFTIRKIISTDPNTADRDCRTQSKY